MQLKSASDFWSGALFVAVGLGAVWDAIGRGVGSLVRPGPGLLPLGLGALLALLGALLWFKALTIEAERAATTDRGPGRALLAVVLGVAGGALLLDVAGAWAALPVAGVLAAFGWHGLALRHALLAGLAGATLAAAVALAVVAGVPGVGLPGWAGGG
jgi:hypothetical protein